MNKKTWQTKLHARLHNPADRAFVLLSDSSGQETGPLQSLHNRLLKDELTDDMRHWVEQADSWSSAADLPQWPAENSANIALDSESSTPIENWARVDWAKNSQLIHPLSGWNAPTEWFADVDPVEIRNRSLSHFESLTDAKYSDSDWKQKLLACWRFGPELGDSEGNSKLGELWPLLPADTRVPDHSIWDHLDLTSAFAGAFAADNKGEAALLTLSIGPVQPFIAAARSTSDLWAGSHLLARLSWEAMRVICDKLGPDAILFPRLRGIPQVDVWLRDDCGLRHEWFESCEWSRCSNDDSNPLFAAALPNRFVAVLPAENAGALVQEIRQYVRDWLQNLGADVVDRLLEAAKLKSKDDPRDETIHAYRQMREQLEGFPEIHWAIVPFSLIHTRDEKQPHDLDTSFLSSAMEPFFSAESGREYGFLESEVWQVLRREIRWREDAPLWSPNPGVLYPAVYDLAERVLAAAKAVRPFPQTEQTGWRCSLTGETEWLTTSADQLNTSWRSQDDTLWAKIARNKPAWAKKGEHLGALSAIKRLWPTIFSEELKDIFGQMPERFVVSTHTFALASQLDRWLGSSKKASEKFDNRLKAGNSRTFALPRGLIRRHRHQPQGKLDSARMCLALLDEARESDDENKRIEVERIIGNELQVMEGNLTPSLENYYALVLLDGDRMGAILSGEQGRITYLDSFHPHIAQEFRKWAETNPEIKRYGEQERAISLNRHVAISSALNDFSLRVVPQVVEGEHLGRVIYAGGDDVLAMLPVADLFPVMQRLRDAYSGEQLSSQNAAMNETSMDCRDGFAYLKRRGLAGRIMPMMGGATASCGAVVAHYKTPLAAALRELRAAEQRAKNEGGRDAFSITLLKRAGGDLRFTGKWSIGSDGDRFILIQLMERTCSFLANPSVSRRAVYHSLVWLKDLPSKPEEEMLCGMLAYQLSRQVSGGDSRLHEEARSLANSLGKIAVQQFKPSSWLTDLLSISEFLAREVRSPGGVIAENANEDKVA